MSSDRDRRKRVLDLITNDTSGLLETASDRKNSKSASTSIIERSLQEILDFVTEHGCLPKENPDSVREYQLATRLEIATASPEFERVLEKLDANGLLKKVILAESKEGEVGAMVDRFNLLSNEGSSEIFKLVHVERNSKLNPFNMSHRIRCLNFYEFEPHLNKVHLELANKTRKLVEFDPEMLIQGSFFVLSGVLGYFAKAEVTDVDYEFKSGGRNRADGRTLCIFDNGTESRMLYRSLIKALQADGFLISGPRDVPVQALDAAEGDQSLGYVYVLKTLNPNLKNYEDLYKIGFTSGLVGSRIANCEKEATYLFSRVKVAATYRCYNINAATVEEQLHKVFETTRLDFEIRDSQGNKFKPREWFLVRMQDIERAIELVQLNELASHSYDPKYGFVEKSNK
jgi:hypothetical protein